MTVDLLLLGHVLKTQGWSGSVSPEHTQGFSVYYYCCFFCQILGSSFLVIFVRQF